jgi:hypothetical protein
MPGNAFDVGWRIIGNVARLCRLDISVADVEVRWSRFPLNSQKWRIKKL